MSSLQETCRIIIVGAGVIGLTTACTVLKEYVANENLRLTIITESYSPDTTGDVSAGYWEPYGLKDLDERTLRWASYTYEIFLKEFFSTKAAQAGIMKVPSYVLKGYNVATNEAIISEKPQFHRLVRHSRSIDQNEINTFDHLKPRSGFAMSSFVVEVRKYLPLLHRFLQSDPRVEFVKKKIHSLTELKDDADVIINCTGLASRFLVGDQAVRPARGQVIRVYAPWIKAVYQFETDYGIGYIIPQSDTVVLGGTFQLDDWNTNADENDTKKILNACSHFLPALKEIREGKVQVGLRPYRDGGVRLEHEKTIDGIDIVHCYGHSGAGVTLSWGCARDVVGIVKTLLPPDPKGENDVPEHEQLWRLTTNSENFVFRAQT